MRSISSQKLNRVDPSPTVDIRQTTQRSTSHQHSSRNVKMKKRSSSVDDVVVSLSSRVAAVAATATETAAEFLVAGTENACACSLWDCEQRSTHCGVRDTHKSQRFRALHSSPSSVTSFHCAGDAFQHSEKRRQRTVLFSYAAPSMLAFMLLHVYILLPQSHSATAYQLHAQTLPRVPVSTLTPFDTSGDHSMTMMTPNMFTKSPSLRSKRLRIQSSAPVPRKVRILSGGAVPLPPNDRGVLGFRLQGDDDTSLSTHIQQLQRKPNTQDTEQRREHQGHQYYKLQSETQLNGRTNNVSEDSSRPQHNGRTNHMREDSTRPVSSVDAQAWNLPEPLWSEPGAIAGVSVGTGSGSSSATFARSSPRFTDASLRIAVRNAALNEPPSFTTATPTTSIPWIPEARDIEVLTVVQLKEELNVRALKRTGNKIELQQRFKEWCNEQIRRQNLLQRGAAHDGDLTALNLRSAYGAHTGSATSSNPDSISPPTPPFEHELLSWNIDASPLLDQSSEANRNTKMKEDDNTPEQHLQVDSLAEWARTVDLKPLLNRREAIQREKLEGKKSQRKPTKSLTDAIQPSEYLTVLKMMFDKPASPYSNREVKQMYAAAKHADQIGDRELSKRILIELKAVTPNDARVYRRLARMEQEDGKVEAARDVLQEGLRTHPENAFLWSGLGQLEGSIGNEALQKKYWEKAIEVDPSIPHSYHALGTFEHTKGRVANAMRILKSGLEYCPTNHRLHHALGDLYRDAKMLNMATSSYLKAIKHGPLVSHGFAYTALAYVAYEEGRVAKCREWLCKAVQLNNGRHANGWVSLAQFEESEGRVDAARSACIAGIGQYERGLLSRYSGAPSPQRSSDDRIFLEDPVALKNRVLKAVPSYRSGDRFFNVYRNWLRLEERYGTVDTVEEVYNRASVAFQHEWKLSLDMAQYFARLNIPSRTRFYFAEACARAGSVHGDPYRLFAEFECSRRDFIGARKILFSGAVSLIKATKKENGTAEAMLSASRGLAELFLSWAVCEWQLSNFLHAQKLFQQALHITNTTPSSAVSSKTRALILFVLARFEHSRGEHRRAQHFIGLCLKENSMPRESGGNAKVWDLWALVAYEMGSSKLALQCQEKADDTRRVGESHPQEEAGVSLPLSEAATPLMQQLLRRDPWHFQIFGAACDSPSNINLSLLPERIEERTERYGNTLTPTPLR